MIDTTSPLFIHSSDIILILDEDGKILTANPMAKSKYPEGLIGQTLYDITTDIAHDRIRRSLDGKTSDRLVIDFRVGKNDVQLTWCHHQFDVDKNTHLFMCHPYVVMSEDENIRWQLALESTDAGFWFWEIWSDVMYFSERLETMLGYEAGGLSAKFSTLRTLVHPEDGPKIRKVIEPFLAGEVSTFKIECRCRRKDGRYMWITAMGSRSVDAAGHEIAVGWHFDIDEQKRSEEQLRRSEERSQLLLQSIPDLLFVFDRQGKYLEVQTTAEDKLVMPAEQVLGHYVHEFFPEAFNTLWLGYIAQVIDTNKPIIAEYDIDVASGHTYFEARLFPRPDNTVMAIIRDVTTRKKAQEEAQIISERFELFLRNAPATIFSFQVFPDSRSEYTYIAGRAKEMFESDPEEQIGTDVFNRSKPPYILQEDRISAADVIRLSSETDQPFNWVGRFVLPSGRIRWINTIASPVKMHDGRVQFNGISFDVTHERELAQQVQEQQVMMSSSSRLTALGEMAGGIAHEINNPLTVAHAHASRLRDTAESGKPLDVETVIRSAQKIESVCMRISRIIAGLRSIARDGGNDRFVLVPLKPIIDDALSLSTEKFRHRQIDLTVDTVPENLAIECRSVQISQVIVNLLLNAQHAVEVLPGTRWIRLSVFERPTTVEIRVSDSGAGIPPEIRDRIFDPFFTTKEVGKGTGLGLSVSASIAEAHGGALYLDENEINTTFVLILQKRHLPSVGKS